MKNEERSKQMKKEERRKKKVRANFANLSGC